MSTEQGAVVQSVEERALGQRPRNQLSHIPLFSPLKHILEIKSLYLPKNPK